MKRPKKWQGRCGCGALGIKHGGLITCEPCLTKDNRSGYGCCKTRGPKR